MTLKKGSLGETKGFGFIRQWVSKSQLPLVDNLIADVFSFLLSRAALLSNTQRDSGYPPF